MKRFFVVGAQRAGTTYLYRLLDEHPRIEMARPERPEPKFFLLDERYAQGLEHYERAHYTEADVDARGEKSTSYCESDVAADRLAAAYPDAGIVFVLREPVARAVSNYWFSRANGLETLPLDEALSAEEGRDYDRSLSTNPFAYRARSRYVELVDRYAQRFPRANLHLLLYEDLVRSEETLAALYRFLEVDPSFRPSAWGSVVNAAPRGPEGAELPAERVAELRAEFAPFNQRLAEAYGLDLSAWR